MTDITIGDVCLDLAQGRPVLVVSDTRQTAAEWSGDNNYDLVENYGNARLGTTPDDRVFDVVYCSDAKSKPSKTYAYPESRLLRIEAEAATDDGLRVHERIARDVLEDVFSAAYHAAGGDAHEADWLLDALARHSGLDDSVIRDGYDCGLSAYELARSEADAAALEERAELGDFEEGL